MGPISGFGFRAWGLGGSRARAGPRAGGGHKEECLSPCSGPDALTWVRPAGPGREAMGRNEGCLCLAPIPTFRVVMIRKRGQGRAVKGLRSGGIPLLSSCPFLFQAPSPRIFGSPVGSPE
jgi:hypothetical protein